MEELKEIKHVTPSPFLKQKVMDKIASYQNEAPKTIKGVAVAAFVINFLVITYYIKSNEQSNQSEYQLFSTETIINY
tara:strand:- start:1057 stop:1287 length:231 start_codon:yes stop_codon:yes gene_type:complete